ncbi:NADH oxidase [Brevibacillus reuszeri]|uniref:SagB family peptide dehydrogenase n=1 Tax=Brevibacillus reuszeri TaxID=54915 RepID=UPI001B072AA8|nr:SagB family peptide dehydrogenase [Brevibacillus reuszeri]GIO06648.1 NADH oxidase [Brevibacillus reuszeri]
MSLDTFIHHLHFDIEKVNPPDIDVDWEDAPLPYKLYRGLPTRSLPTEIPLTLNKQKLLSDCKEPTFSQLGAILWYAYGVTQLSQDVLQMASEEDEVLYFQSKRRFLPSGGALYPSELYVYLKLNDLGHGIYHYDAAHHRLVLLREGNFDSYLTRAVGGNCDLNACFGAMFVSTFFWKNFFKYHHFSYRLQGLDAGVLLGQLLSVTKEVGISSGICFQFLDRAVNHLLGLSDQEESVYAIVPLSVDDLAWDSLKKADGKRQEKAVTASELIKELPQLFHAHYVKSKNRKDPLLPRRMNEAAMLESTSSFSSVVATNPLRVNGSRISLPVEDWPEINFAQYCRNRLSPEIDFMMGKIQLSQLSRLLLEAIGSFSYRNDLGDGQEMIAKRLALSVCLHQVEGLVDGAYHFDHEANSLALIQNGDHRLKLQLGLSMDNVNLYQVPLCFHVIGDIDHQTSQSGPRGYRIQQMEAGIVVQRLLMSAYVCGMGGHPLLGYDARLCDEIYQIRSKQKTSLIQIPVGPYRHRPRFQGGLHG